MKRLSAVALLLGMLMAFAVQAQDAQKPAPAADEAKREPAAKPAPGPGQEPDPKILEDIFNCLAEGLTPEWKKAWFVISETGRDERSATRSFEAKFFFANDANDKKGKPLRTCGGEKVLDGVKALNDYLPEGQQRWTGATFTFTRDGKFEAKYDFSKPKPAAPAKKAAKPAAKKKQETAK